MSIIEHTENATPVATVRANAAFDQQVVNGGVAEALAQYKAEHAAALDNLAQERQPHLDGTYSGPSFISSTSKNISAKAQEFLTKLLAVDAPITVKNTGRSI